jgi:hypothetical protein
MKRSAAIIGKTPAFLRWAIEKGCPFRTSESRSVADAAFKDVRSLRAISVAEISDRIVDGVCLHPDAVVDELDSAMGFPVEEVCAAFGSQEAVRSTCGSCPANVPVSKVELDTVPVLSKAGCFGWLPFGNIETDGTSGFMRLMEHYANPAEEHDRQIVEKFENAFEQSCATDSFLKTSPAWYGVWSQRVFAGATLTKLNEICDFVRSESLPWRRLGAAVKTSMQEKLTLHVDLTPPGYSNGITWQTEGQCANCLAAVTDDQCVVCGSSSSPFRPRKMKVLGLRPYLKLVSIYGREETSRLVNAYRSV